MPDPKYHTTPAHNGYGARIWLNTDYVYAGDENGLKHESLLTMLNMLSKWGARDKTTDDGLSAWEFNDRNFKLASAATEAYINSEYGKK